MQGDVAKPDTFTVAEDYYEMQRNEYGLDNIRNASAAATEMRIFVDCIMDLQKRYNIVSRQNSELKAVKQINETKKQINAVKKEITTLKNV